MKPRIPQNEDRRISLKTLAEYLNLSPATVSIVVNDAPGAKSIPLKTRERVLEGAKKFNFKT